MKLVNIFKKANKVTTVKTETLNKTQLSKVIGGGDGTVLVETDGLPVKGSIVKGGINH